MSPLWSLCFIVARRKKFGIDHKPRIDPRWREYTGDHGTIAKSDVAKHRLYSFLTTEPNGVVNPVHEKAMPVKVVCDRMVATSPVMYSVASLPVGQLSAQLCLLYGASMPHKLVTSTLRRTSSMSCRSWATSKVREKLQCFSSETEDQMPML
jgi:hypothetical protein